MIFSLQGKVLTKQRKKCFVPGCNSNEERDLNTIFIFCCKYHFKLSEDMENYMRYRFMGGNKKLKKSVLPRFNLPTVNKENSTERRGIMKMELDIPDLMTLNQTEEIVFIKSERDFQNTGTILPNSNIPIEMDGCIVMKTESDSPERDSILPEANILDQMNGSIVMKTEQDLPELELHLSETAENQLDDYIFVKVEPGSTEVDLDLSKINMIYSVETNSNMGEDVFQYSYNSNQHTDSLNQQSSGNSWNRSKGLSFPCILDTETNGINSSENPTDDLLLHGVNHDFKHMFTSSSDDMNILHSHKCVQVNFKTHVRRKGITCKPITRENWTSTEFKKSQILVSNEDWLSETSDSQIEEVKIEILKNRMFETRTKAFIENDPLLFLGVPKNSLHLIKNMQKHLNIPIQHIYCVLKKIRLNLSNEVLSYDFGLSNSQISQIFEKTVPLIADCLKEQIFWPEKNVISKNLPVQFRNRLKKVQSILNILEIKMEKSNSIQGLRFPSYESTETAKFLVSSTPNGFINFISMRYNKGNSDVSIVKTSGFLENIPEEVTVLSLADRGFKYVDNVLRRKNCRLIRLPSISMKKNRKEEPKFTRWLASVRIHVKRLMNHLRDFKILENSVNLGKRSESLLNDIVIIAAALSNIQLSLRKEEDAV